MQMPNALKLFELTFCITISSLDHSSFQNHSHHQNPHHHHQQQQTTIQSSPTATPLADYSNWLHACSSYCRIQLFRLKGAQRKLKTDRSKIEKLNPADLRRRYQPSSKITLLYNGPFDSLYSMMPPLTCSVMEHRHNHNHYHGHAATAVLSSSTSASTSSASLTAENMLNGGVAVATAAAGSGGEFVRNSISANGASFHLNSGSPSPSAPAMYNPSVTGYAGLQPYLVAPMSQQQQQHQQHQHHQQSNLTTLTTVQYNQHIGASQMNDMESSYTPSPVVSIEEQHQFYFDSNNQNHYSKL